MEKAFDMTSVRLTLRQGIAKGYWTIEDLNKPSPGWEENAKRFRLHHPKYEQHVHRNLLRDPDAGPAVETTSPRDIAPASGPTPAEAPPLPVTLEVDNPITPTIDAYLEDLDF